MRILLAAATSHELAPLLAVFQRVRDEPPRITTFTHAGHRIDVLITGVGMVATAAWCARTLASGRYDLALNLGVCGAFDPALDVTDVVHVTSEQLSELGAEDGGAFLTIQDLGLADDEGVLPLSGRMFNEHPPRNAVLEALPAVRGITVNTVHGHALTIADAVKRFDPQVESMEGAAFMYACLIQEVPFAEVRAVSNRVERRNRAGWKMKESVDGLADVARRIIEAA